MQYVPFEAGIEVKGRSLRAIFDGFKSFSVLASEYLVAEGVGRRGDDGLVAINLEGWYPVDGFLRAFRRVGDSVGDRVLFDIGAAVPQNAEFPPFVKDVPSAVGSIDIAYHMNHRKRGAVMFDPDSGIMMEGIGHYGCEPAGERRLRSVCENPYPCAFDLGLVTAMAQRFAPYATVEHAPGTPCRRNGADRCTYEVRW